MTDGQMEAFTISPRLKKKKKQVMGTIIILKTVGEIAET